METQKIVNLSNSSENGYSKLSKKENGTLLAVKQRITIRTEIQSNF